MPRRVFGLPVLLTHANRRGLLACAALGALSLALMPLTIVPSYLYNQMMLLPTVLLIVRDRYALWSRNQVTRILMILVAILLVWPWVVSVALAVLSYLLPLARLEPAWALPFWTVLPLPLGVAALVLIRSYQIAFTTRAEPSAA